MDCKSIICDANNLYEAYLKTIKGSKWKETTQKFALNYLRNIFKLIDELLKQSYLPGEEGEFTLNERGKIRPITTLQPRDRLVRHVVCDEILMPEVEKKIIYDNGASIKRSGAILDSYKDNQLVKMLGIMDSEGNVDIDVLAEELKKNMPKEGVRVDVPIIGTLTFKENDVDKLYEYITVL